MKFKLEYGIILVGIVLLCIIVSPLFKGPGLPVNIDLPAQYVRIMCLSEQGTAPNNWCPYINAGTPTSQYYYPVYDQLLAWLFKFSSNFGLQANGHPEYSLFFAYKINLIFALLLPAIAIWLWLKDSHPVGAAVGFTTYLCLTAGWHGSGFQETILVGFWHYMLSVGGMLISCYYFNRVLQNRSNKDLVLFLISLLFILHPMTIFTAMVVYIGLIIYNYKTIREHIVAHLVLVILSLGITAFYWIPFLMKMSYFPSSLGAMLDWSLFMGYIWEPIPEFLIFFAVCAIGYMLYKKDKEQYPLLVMFSSLCIFTALDFIKSPLNTIQVGVRIGAFLVPVIIILYSLMVSYLFNWLSKPEKGEGKTYYYFIALFIAVYVVTSMFFITYNESKMIMLSSDFALPEVYRQLGDTLGPGRILMEDMLAVSGSHITSMMPILTKREIISFSTIVFPKFNLMDNTGPSLFNTNVEDWTEKDLKEVFTRYNIKWALIYSPNYFYLFNNTMKMQYQMVGPFTLFDTGINASYVDGNIDVIEYTGITAKVFVNGPGKIMFKVNYYPNWKAKLGDKEILTYSCEGLTCVDITSQQLRDAERNIVILEYKSLWYEWVGYIISVLTTFGLFSFFIKGWD